MSILEIDREMQLDRQRRYFFCCCFAEVRKDFQKSEYGEWRDNMIITDNTIRRFLNAATDEIYWHWFNVPHELSLDVLEWITYVKPYPEKFKKKLFSRRNYISNSLQLAAVQSARKRLEYIYRFKALNEDNNYTESEQDAAQKALEHLLSIPEGL